MREAYRILPVYAGDVSGIASALYELGGMVVIHDPSGCNSTYNTHDEIRWYDQESYIFISGLNMRDAVLGNDRKLVDDIAQAAKDLTPAPRFIALCNSPIPYLTGCDFGAICRLVEERCGILTFYVPSNGMRDYVHGAGQAYLEYARHMLPRWNPQKGKSAGLSSTGKGSGLRSSEGEWAEEGQERIRVNLLGATPLSFGNEKVIPQLCRWMENHDFQVLSVWSMGSRPEDLNRSSEADVNLVLSDTAFPLAEYMRETYGIPYVAGVPVSKRAGDRLLAALRLLGGSGEETEEDRGPEEDSRTENSLKEKRPVFRVYIGEAVLCQSLAADCKEEAAILCPFSDSRPHLEEGEFFDGEEDLISHLDRLHFRHPKEQMEVWADPMYRTVLPSYAGLIPLPTLALSGRIYQGHFPDYSAWATEGPVGS